MSDSIQLTLISEPELPRKRLCAYRGNGLHYFIASAPNQIFCSRRHEKLDDSPLRCETPGKRHPATETRVVAAEETR